MPSRTVTGTPCTITLHKGDITQEDAEAIVNAANSSLLGGGGVDGAIHSAGGPEILRECRAIRARQGELPVGEAVLSGAGRLRARAVIHTVGPVWRGGSQKEDELLMNAYRNSLALAAERNFRSVAFPCISTGAYGFPPERASRIAIETIETFLRARAKPAEVRLVVFSDRDYRIYEPYFASPRRNTDKP
jgi:O-acetyl-ADP-ribose deacetylase (regulator of RNase III)